MTELLVIVEGRTEQLFVNRVLAPQLEKRAVYTNASIARKQHARGRGASYRGGGGYSQWREDISRALGNRNPAFAVTTLFDYYGLPKDFPQLADAAKSSSAVESCTLLERRLAEEFGQPRNFIPYLQCHEFEALVLASFDSLSEMMTTSQQRRAVRELRNEIGSIAPEMINDGVNTAPSVRLKRTIPRYLKVDHGIGAIQRTGLAHIRARCPRFDRWVTTLEELPNTL